MLFEPQSAIPLRGHARSTHAPASGRSAEFLESQERFDNHFHDSAVWRQFCEGPAASSASPPMRDG